MRLPYSDTEARNDVRWALIEFKVGLFTSLIPGADSAEDGVQVVTGKDWNGTPVSRGDAARGLALSLVPGFKKLRKVSKTLGAAEDLRKAGKKVDKTAKALTVGKQLNKAKEDLDKCVNAEGAKAAPGNDDLLVRRGKDRESAVRLDKQAKEAERGGNAQNDVPFGHGVSVTSPESNGRLSRDPSDAVAARRKALEDAGFEMRYTPTRKDTDHHTVQLPNPVTEPVADLFNRVFGRKPKGGN